jgi:diguanylate cyclase (GGDEF)-like protein/PAS domain S-box-containing protein
MRSSLSSNKGFFRYQWVIFYLILLPIIVVAGWFVTGYLGDRASHEILNENESAISVISIHLTDELNKIEGAVKALSGSPWIHPALTSRKDQDIVRANSALDRYNSALDVTVSYLMDSSGMTIASSNRNAPDSFVGKSYQFRPYFTQAKNGILGRYFALGVTSLKRGFYASYPVRDSKGIIMGVVTMKKDLDDIEASLSNYPHFFFINPQGIIFLSSKKEMLFKSLWPLDESIQKGLLTSKQFGEKPFEAVMSQEVLDRMNAALNGKKYLVSRKVINPEGWSIVLMTPTERSIIYKAVGIIMTVLLCTFIVIPLIVSYRTVRSAEMVRESEDRFRRLSDSTFEGIFIHDKGDILDVNQSMIQMLGYEYNEIIGKNVMDFIAPESKELALHNIKTGYEKPYELLMQKRDGTIITMEVAGKPISYAGKTARVVAHRDITERKVVEKKFQESSELYRLLAEKSFAGVYVVQDGKFRFLNNNAIAYSGYTAEEMIEKDSINIVHPEDREQLKKNAVEMVRGERTFPYEFRIITKDGQTRWIMETVTSIYYEGKRAILGNSMDITERKRMEEQILALSITDQLTGLHNRRGFLSLAEQQLKLSDRTKRGMLLFFSDLDGMKWINDTWGHEEGDKALIEVATILKETFRSSDIIARMGGDEFAVLAIDPDEINPEILINRLQNQLDTHNDQRNRRYRISISAGASYYDPENPSSIDELMARADKLMYEQKKNKKSHPV